MHNGTISWQEFLSSLKNIKGNFVATELPATVQMCPKFNHSCWLATQLASYVASQLCYNNLSSCILYFVCCVTVYAVTLNIQLRSYLYIFLTRSQLLQLCMLKILKQEIAILKFNTQLVLKLYYILYHTVLECLQDNPDNGRSTAEELPETEVTRSISTSLLPSKCSMFKFSMKLSYSQLCT